MSTEVEPVEHEDRWVLNLRGLSVVRISIDFRPTLVLDAGWEVVLEAPARLSTGSLHTSPGLPLTPESQDVALALPLFGAKVLSAVVFKSGVLRMVFDSGKHLTCSADASFEAWQVTGPRGWRFISLPGGDLAVTRSSSASPASTPSPTSPSSSPSAAPRCIASLNATRPPAAAPSTSGGQ